MYTIKAIIPPHVFIEDQDGQMDRVALQDFINSPRINAGARKLETGKFETVSSNIDPDCVGGVCPIK